MTALLTSLHVLSEDVFFNNLRFLLRQQEAPAVIGTLILFAFYFCCVSFFSGEKKVAPLKELTLNKGDGGQINVTVEAVKGLAERTALAVTNVREVTATVLPGSGEKELTVKMAMSILAGANAPQVSSEVIAGVKSELNSTLSVMNADVSVSVTEISNTGAAKRVF